MSLKLDPSIFHRHQHIAQVDNDLLWSQLFQSERVLKNGKAARVGPCGIIWIFSGVLSFARSSIGGKLKQSFRKLWKLWKLWGGGSRRCVGVVCGWVRHHGVKHVKERRLCAAEERRVCPSKDKLSLSVSVTRLLRGSVCLCLDTAVCEQRCHKRRDNLCFRARPLLRPGADQAMMMREFQSEL